MAVEPFTQEQLEWISAQTERATKKAVRAWARRASVGFLILALGVAGAIYTENQHYNAQQRADTIARAAIVDSGRAATTISCNRDFRTTNRLRAIIADQRPRIAEYVAEGTLTEAQAERAYDDIDKNLKRTPQPDCRKALNSITQDPNDRIIVPEPLYPKPEKG